MQIKFRVDGVPRSQGSMKTLRHRITGRTLAIHDRSLVAWRDRVAYAARNAWNRPPHDGGAALKVTFYLPRPKSARKRTFPNRQPDLDKLLRACFDALELGGVLTNDARIVETMARKQYADHVDPGVEIELAIWPV